MPKMEIGLCMEIGLYDVLDQAQMESDALAADVYDDHIRGAQEAEQMDTSTTSPSSARRLTSVS